MTQPWEMDWGSGNTASAPPPAAAAPAGNTAPPPWRMDWGGSAPTGDRAPTRITVRPQDAVNASFADVQTQPEAPGLRAGMERVATQAAGTPPASFGTRMATDFLNQGAAAGQGTTPDIQSQERNLLSSEVHQNDAGELLFRDPRSGQMVPTDQNQHIVLRDPADQRVKVYARTADTNEGALASAGRIAMTGMGAGAPTARASLGATQNIRPLASDMMAVAKPHYRAFEQEASQVAIPRETAAGIADRFRSALDRIGLTEEMAGAPARAAINMMNSDTPLTLDFLQKVKRVAGRGFNNSEKDARDAAGALSSEISKVIRDVSPGASQSLRTGDQIHSTALAMQDLQRKANVAGLRAGRAGYGGNAVNSMRQVLAPIVQRAVEGKTTPFKPNEIQAMREIVEGTRATNAARFGGQLSPSKGIIQTIGEIGALHTVGPAALAIPALGMAANKLAKILTRSQIQRLQELVAKRSPAYPQAVAKAVRRYEVAQADFVTNPSPAKLGGYVTASRALSLGLTRDGIKVTSGDLLRSIQGPVAATAQDEQP